MGRWGVRLSTLGLGSYLTIGYKIDAATARETVRYAYDNGINFIDTADIYSRWVDGNPGGVAETIIGEWLSKSDIDRSQIILATKVRGVMGDGPNDEGKMIERLLEDAQSGDGDGTPF